MQIPASAFGYWSFLILSSILAGVTIYVFLVWRAVGGIRGFALLTAALCATLLTASFALSYSGEIHFVGERVFLAVVADTQIPITWLVGMQQSLWFPLAIALFVLGDLYASDHNSHRSVTYITYRWYARLRDRKTRSKHAAARNGGTA